MIDSRSGLLVEKEVADRVNTDTVTRPRAFEEACETVTRINTRYNGNDSESDASDSNVTALSGVLRSNLNARLPVSTTVSGVATAAAPTAAAAAGSLTSEAHCSVTASSP